MNDSRACLLKTVFFFFVEVTMHVSIEVSVSSFTLPNMFVPCFDLVVLSMVAC